MKKIAQALLLSVAVCLSIAAPAAAETPAEVVEEMMAKIKSAGTPAPFIEYVNWSSAYAAAPENMKQQMKISSAAEMKAAFTKMFADTKGFFEEQFKERLASVPAEQRPMYEENLSKMTQMIEAQQAQMKEQIQQTEYKVGESKVEGDQATVMLTQSYQGQSRDREIQLTKASGEWLLDSATIFAASDEQAPPAAAPPAAGSKAEAPK